MNDLEFVECSQNFVKIKKETTMKSIQQGDCILEYVAKLPKEAKKVAFNGIAAQG